MDSRIYALVGPHGAGKATLAIKAVGMGAHAIPKYTTKVFLPRDISARLCRGISRDDFLNEPFIVCYTHKGDYYGIKKSDMLEAQTLHRASILLLDMNNIQQIKKIVANRLVIIYVMADYVAIVDRLLRMGHTNSEIQYHLQYAENNKEFDGWKTADYVIKNTRGIDAAERQLMAIMGLVRPLTAVERRRAKL